MLSRTLEQGRSVDSAALPLVLVPADSARATATSASGGGARIAPEAAAHATYVSFFGSIFKGVPGFLIDTHFNRGMALVKRVKKLL